MSSSLLFLRFFSFYVEGVGVRVPSPGSHVEAICIHAFSGLQEGQRHGEDRDWYEVASPFPARHGDVHELVPARRRGRRLQGLARLGQLFYSPPS